MTPRPATATEPRATGAFSVRAARLPEDAPALMAFVAGLQEFEHVFEPNRRTDPLVGHDYFRMLMKRVEERDGRVLVAERDGELLGWCVTLVDEGEVYVVEEERRSGFIAELFVVEDARGQGVGRALIAAAETSFKVRGLPVASIAVLPGNRRAREIYEAAGYEAYTLFLRKKL